MNKFTSNVHRLMQATFDDYTDTLKIFLNYINETPLIKEYIVRCGGYQDNIQELFPVGECLDLSGCTEEEEVARIYSAITIMYNEYEKPFIAVILAYSHSKKFQDCLKAFNDRVIFIFVTHIENYLKEIGIDMGLDDKITYNINGNQVNFAKDNGTVNAVQNNNGIDANELHKLISAMKSELSPDLSDEDKADAEESIDIIETELESGKPDEQKVRSQFKLLSRIDSGVKFASAVASLLTFADKVFPFLADVAPFYMNLLK